jgi:hypothetical protein
MLGYGYGTAGRPAEARRILAGLHASAEERYLPPYYLALVYASLGEADGAIDALERAFAVRDGWLVWLKVDQRLDPLRGHPRFQALLARMRFPD